MKLNMKFYVVCFVDGGFDKVVSGHRTKEAAKEAAKKIRNDGGGRWDAVSFRVVPVGTLRRLR